MTSGASMRAARSRTRSRVPSSRPIPGPSTTADAPSVTDITCSDAARRIRPSRDAQPTDMTSVSFTSKMCSSSAGTATVA